MAKFVIVEMDSVGIGELTDASEGGDAFEALGRCVPEILGTIGDDDIVVFTADHGCDPSTTSTDHSREYIPIRAFGKT